VVVRREALVGSGIVCEHVATNPTRWSGVCQGACRGHRVGAGGAGDLTYQAAADAMVAILAKLGTFRGESRFTTWAYRFVVLEVSAKLGRHYWRRHPAAVLEAQDWERLPDRFGVDPGEHVQRVQLVAAVRQAVDEVLTEHQRALFVAVVVNAVPLDALAECLGLSRNAIYKSVFDARRKIRAHLVAHGYLERTEAGSS
jgi:RNA polymerase sigma-70 factor (ECF subfamily)